MRGIRTLCVATIATGLAFTAMAAPATNPFTEPSTLPLQAPRFDIILDSDYQPAIEEGIRQHLAEIDAIANNTAPPTFENTIVAMERSGRLVDRANRTFDAVVEANTNDVLQKVQRDEAPKLAAHRDSIFLNPKLFGRIRALYDQRDALKLDPESLQLLKYVRSIPYAFKLARMFRVHAYDLIHCNNNFDYQPASALNFLFGF